MDDPQQVTQLALRKELLPRGNRGMLRRALDDLLSDPVGHPLIEMVEQIQQERAALHTARSNAIDALDELRRAIASSRVVALGRTLGGENDSIFDEVIDVDLDTVAAALSATYVGVFAPAPLVRLLPPIPLCTGTNPAQSKCPKRSNQGDKSRQLTSQIKDTPVN